MENILMGLNDKQKQAVTTSSQKVLVVAGAGSGKTKVLTTRIAYLLNQGVSPGEICAFTFTNKAAREMRSRLEKEFKVEKLPNLSTFHSYAFSFLQEPSFYSRLGFKKKPTIIFDADKSKIIRTILNKYEADHSNKPYFKAISDIKNGNQIDYLNEQDLTLLNVVYKEYQQNLKESSVLDFDDMALYFLELSKDYSFKSMLQYKYILVDECQDTNNIQYQMIKILSSQYQNIFMVGDEDQLIYSFRNKNQNIIEDFKNQANEIIILNENYRSTKNILEHANKLIDFNSSRLKKELYSNLINSGIATYRNYSTAKEEAEFVGNKIKSLMNSGVEPKDIAVLYRNNVQSLQIEKELNYLKIPYTIFGGNRLFEYKEIRLLIYAYQLLDNPDNVIAFENIYPQVIGLELTEYNAFIAAYKNGNQDLIRFASGYTLLPKIARFGFEFLKLQDQLKTLDKANFFQELLEILKLNTILREKYKDKPSYQRLMFFKELIDSSEKSVMDTITDMVLDKVEEKNNTVSLLTIHKAKGLEFKVVFIIGFNEGIIPSYNLSIRELEEERRLAYVAITRAKESLYISSSTVHYINGNIKRLKPSSFLIEADFKEVAVMNFFGNYWYNH